MAGTHGFTGREVSWVSMGDKNRGKAEVWIDGVKEATVDLYSAAADPRQVVFRKALATGESLYGRDPGAGN